MQDEVWHIFFCGDCIKVIHLYFLTDIKLVALNLEQCMSCSHKARKCFKYLTVCCFMKVTLLEGDFTQFM
jgi:hypothetical protein